MSTPRPVSPFLILLFGAAATALAAEWLRFGWGPAAAALPLVLGAGATVTGVRRSFTARRRWRAAHERPSVTIAATESGPVRIAGGSPTDLAYAGPEVGTAPAPSAIGIAQPAARPLPIARPGEAEHRPPRTSRPPSAAPVPTTGPREQDTAPSAAGARSR